MNYIGTFGGGGEGRSLNLIRYRNLKVHLIEKNFFFEGF